MHMAEDRVIAPATLTNTNEYDDTMTIPSADDQNTTITMKIKVGGNC